MPDDPVLGRGQREATGRDVLFPGVCEDPLLGQVFRPTQRRRVSGVKGVADDVDILQPNRRVIVSAHAREHMTQGIRGAGGVGLAETAVSAGRSSARHSGSGTGTPAAKACRTVLRETRCSRAGPRIDKLLTLASRRILANSSTFDSITAFHRWEKL
jgi:hypothetical protein